MQVKQPAKAQQAAAVPAKQPSLPVLPSPKQFHPGLPEDFFTRNYCQELAHKELASYVAKVRADASFKAALERIFASDEKLLLGAGHSNAITLWVYSGYPLNNYNHGELIGHDYSYADLSGATITNTYFAYPKRRANTTNLHEVSFIGATIDNVVIDHDPSKPARYGFAHDLELGKRQTEYERNKAAVPEAEFNMARNYMFSPKMNYKILESYSANSDAFTVYSVHWFHGNPLALISDPAIALFSDLCAWHDGISPDETFLVCQPPFKRSDNMRDSFMCMHKLKEMHKTMFDSSKVMDMHFKIDPKGNYYPKEPYFSPDSQTLAVMYTLPNDLHGSLIAFFNAHTTVCEGEFKHPRTYIDYAAISFFDNETLMYLTPDDESRKKNHLHILKRSETTRLKKTTVSWKEVASLALPLPYAKELQTFPATGRIGVQYRADGNSDFTQFCFYSFNVKKIDWKKDFIQSFPWFYEKRDHRIRPDGRYLVDIDRQIGSNDLQVISITSGKVVHQLHLDWSEVAFEFTPDGRSLSIIQHKGGLQNEQFIYPLPRAYPEHQVLHSHFEPRFTMIKFNLDPRLDPKKDAQIYPDATPSALKYIAVGLYDCKNNTQESPDDTHSSGSSPDHSPPKNGLLGNQLQQEIERRNQRNHPAPSAPPLDEETLKSIQEQAQVPPPPIPPKPPAVQAQLQMKRNWDQRTSSSTHQVDPKSTSHQTYHQ